MGYIFWGMQKLPPPERAGTYSSFIQFISLGKSLWFVILFQAAIAVYLLQLLFKRILLIENQAYLYFSALVLGLGSSMGWTVATLMPDFFCAASSLIFYILGFHSDRISKVERWFLAALALFCSMQHVSVFFINLLVVNFFVIRWLLRREWRHYRWPIGFLLPIVLLGYLGIGLVHMSLTGRYFISKSSQAFLFGRMAETGILSNYLYQHCGDSQTDLCKVKHWFPMSNESLLWKNPELLRYLGGMEDKKEIFKTTNRAILSSPKYLFQFGQASFKSMMKQLTLVEVGDGLVPFKDIFQLKFFGSDHADYLMSKQKMGINFEKVNTFQFCVLGLFLWLAVYTKAFHNLNQTHKNFLLFIVILLISNALINGGLATPLNRYQTRVFWLVYVWLLAVLYPALQPYFSSERKSPQ